MYNVDLTPRRGLALALLASVAMLAGAAGSLSGVCGPFLDVTDATFCPFVVEIFTLGITTGTTPTTYDPAASVTRLQMAAFLSRSVDGLLRRGSRRAALQQHWTPGGPPVLGLTTVGNNPSFVKSDGADLWVTKFFSLSRVRAADGKLLDTWTSASQLSEPVLIAFGRVLTGGPGEPGQLFMVDPTQPAGAVTLVASNLGGSPTGIAFDGGRIWTANQSFSTKSVSIITPGATIPWSVTTVTTGFVLPVGAVYDGTNVWVTDSQFLRKLDATGAILQTVSVGFSASHPAFDGANIWVPNASSDSVSVVRASSGAVLQTLTGNGLAFPVAAAFDGQRVLVTSPNGDGISLWKASDLTPLGNISTGTGSNPFGACSDGVNFWIALNGTPTIFRF